jgi:SPP1 gp7 family putative phage head morphogenesis protein
LLFISQSFDHLLDILKPQFEQLIENIWNKEFDFFDAELLDEIDAPKWGADDANWEDRLEDDIRAWNYNTQTKVKQGLLRQDNLEDVLDDINDILDQAGRAIDRLALTESTAVGTTAREEIFRKRGVKKYRFYTREDERTCEICGSMHGLIFPVSAMKIGVNASPLHPNCRCFEIPVE